MFRILLLPLFAVLLAYDTDYPIINLDRILKESTFRYSPGRMATIIVVIAGITDLLDGYFARRWNIVTVFGKFLDPVADKLFLMVGLIMLMELERVPHWLVSLLLAREILITGLRGVAAGEGIIIAADKFGKVKYIFQLVGLGFLTWYGNVFGVFAGDIGLKILYVALFISLFSGFLYLRSFMIAIQERNLTMKD